MIETRDFNQVRKFSVTVVGRRYKPTLVLTEAYLNLAAGIKVVAEELQANNRTEVLAENENESEDETEEDQFDIYNVNSY
jgi:hypothetical protein